MATKDTHMNFPADLKKRLASEAALATRRATDDRRWTMTDLVIRYCREGLKRDKRHVKRAK
jgi:hypothetical protein